MRSRQPAIALPSTGPRVAIRTLHHWFPEWHEAAESHRPKDVPARKPRILDGQIVSGEKLLTDPKSPVVKRVVATFDKALGLDMESAGVGRAVLERQKEGIFAELTVLRGISDYVNKDEENQTTRDNWKPYASWTAVAAAKAWIQSLGSSNGVIALGKPIPSKLGNHTARSGPGAQQGQALLAVREAETRYLGRLHPWLQGAVPPAEAAFGLMLEATEHRAVNSVLSVSTNVNRGELLDHVLNDRKVVVTGPSGAGKSYLLRQVLRQAAAQDQLIPVYIDMKHSWRPDLKGLLKAPTKADEIEPSLDALLSASAIDVTASDLAGISDDRQILLIVDALNEVPADSADLVRHTLDQYARHRHNVRILIGDRRPELFYRELRWTVLHLAGVAEGAVQRTVDDRFGEGAFSGISEQDRELLHLPFFLDRAIESGQLRLGSRAGAVHDYVLAAGLSEDDIDDVAPIAFAVFKRGEISLSDDDAACLDERRVLSPLQDSAILVDGVSGLIFSHQLVHQYLAGKHLAANEDDWTYATLDLVTAGAASLDTVGMTIANIEEQPRRDRFLRIVYDWQWRAAVLALAEAQHGDRPVSEALSAALLALAAEKMFDAVWGTRSRVKGLLAHVPGGMSHTMQAAASSEDLLDLVAEMDFPGVGWWSSWRDVFLWRPDRNDLTEREVSLIGSSEPLIGWTVANSLRRFKASDAHMRLLIGIYRSQLRDEPGACATRWRVVHAIGVWPTRENAEFLLEALDDDYGWVIYGAVRSLVEMAALATTDSELRDLILMRLDELSWTLPAHPLSQIPWAAAYRDADSTWPDVVRPLLHTIRDRQKDGERERWEQRVESFEQYARARD